MQQISNTQTDLLSVFFIDDIKGWVGGNNGQILKTTNGGQNWQLINTGYDNIYSISFLNENLGFAISSYITNYYRNGSIIKSTDGGNSWFTVFSTYDFGFIDLFLHQERGWVVGTNGYLVTTTDSGKTWLPQFYITDHWLF